MNSFTYPPSISLAQTPTPLHRLDRVSEELDADLWIKRDDLTGSILTGNKVRKLEFTIAQALSEGADTLITCGGLHSNHCRATAAAAAQLGLKVCLLLRGPQEEFLDGNLLLDGLLGAEVTVLNSSEDHKRLPELMSVEADRQRQLGRIPYIIPVGASDGIGLWGYIKTAAELKNDFSNYELHPDFIVCASGSGGTQAGLSVGCASYGIQSQVLGIAVCDDEAYFQRKIRQDIEHWKRFYQIECDTELLKIEVNDAYIGPGYAKANEEVYDTIQWLAALEGIVLDPVYTGKAFHGLVSEVKRGAFGDRPSVVFVHTGGIFGVYPYRDNFDIKVNNS